MKNYTHILTKVNMMKLKPGEKRLLCYLASKQIGLFCRSRDQNQ